MMRKAAPVGTASMPIPATCPNGHHMTLPDFRAGKRHRCPLCRQEFEVPQAEAAPASGPVARAPTVYDPAEAREKAQWAWTKRGLGFHYARLIIVILSFMVFAVAGALESAQLIRAAGVALWSLLGMSLLGPGLGFIGSLLCIRVPPHVGARRFIALSLLLDVAVIAFIYLYLTENLAGTREAVGLDPEFVAVIIFTLIQLADWISYLFFQRRLAQFFDDSIATDEAMQIMAWGVILGALVSAPALLAPLIGKTPELALAVWIAELVLCFAVLVVAWPLDSAAMYVYGFIFMPFFLLAVCLRLVFRQLTLIGTLRTLIGKAGF
jgi:hypothetical protein